MRKKKEKKEKKSILVFLTKTELRELKKRARKEGVLFSHYAGDKLTQIEAEEIDHVGSQTEPVIGGREIKSSGEEKK